LNVKSEEEHVVYKKTELNGDVDSEKQPWRLLKKYMYYIGLDIHKKTISYCVKDASGRIHSEGSIGATRKELDEWVKTLPQPRMMAMEATIFTGWIYDHLLPHAERVKVAHPLMLRAIAAAKKKNDRIDAGKNPTAQNGSRSRPHHRADLGAGDWGCDPISLAEASDQLLWAVRRGEEFRRPGPAYTHLQTTQQAYPACAG
jgi:hypothetical protein